MMSGIEICMMIFKNAKGQGVNHNIHIDRCEGADQFATVLSIRCMRVDLQEAFSTLIGVYSVLATNHAESINAKMC